MMTKSSAYLTIVNSLSFRFLLMAPPPGYFLGEWVSFFSCSSIPCSAMFASRGEITPPWGVPSSVGIRFPFSRTLALSHLLTCFLICGKVSSFSISLSCLILSKHFRMSPSRIYLGFLLTAECIASIASWQVLPGRNP